MANRAERRRLMKTSELREQAVEALDQTPYIDVEVDNGALFRVWHPFLQSDEAQTRIEAVQAGEGLDRDDDDRIITPNRVGGQLAEPYVIRFAKAMLGDGEHKKFVKAGGNSNDLNLAWSEMMRQQEELADEADGDEDPKGSEKL